MHFPFKCAIEEEVALPGNFSFNDDAAAYGGCGWRRRSGGSRGLRPRIRASLRLRGRVGEGVFVFCLLPQGGPPKSRSARDRGGPANRKRGGREKQGK